MNRAAVVLRWLVLIGVVAVFSGFPGNAKDDFLTAGEIESIREAQEPNKRIILYLDFAQSRLDAVKEKLASKKPKAGQEAQKHLADYAAIMEALEGTLLTARDRRTPIAKGLKEVERRGADFLKYLESLQSDSSPYWDDYRFTLEEAIEMTREELDEAKRGSFPEVEERDPPKEFPSSPPPASGRGENR